MIFYIIFIFVVTSLLLVQYYYPIQQKVLDVIVFVILVLISGFRKRIGGDYDSYVSWYLYKKRDADFEFGFLAIMKLFRALDLSATFLFFFFSFFTCYFVFFGIKKYTLNSNVALLFYILIPSLYLTSFTLIRQSFSVAISFYAFYYLIKKEYLVYLLLIFIGISIHKSCLITFIVFFLVVRFADKIKAFHLYGLIILSFLLSRIDFIQLFRIFFEKTRYLYYFSGSEVQVDFFKIVIMNLQGMFVLYYFQKLKKKYQYEKYILILYCFSIIFINLFSKNSDLARIVTYFRIFEIIILTDLIFLEKEYKKNFFLFFYTLYFGAFLIGIKKDFEIQNKNMPKFIPYKNILWS
jgi:hypothetical protein